MQNHDAAMGAYHRFINRPMHQNHLESTELLVYTNQGVRLRCISLGFLVIQRIILFMLSVGTNFQIFCSATMRRGNTSEFWTLCWEVWIIEKLTLPGIGTLSLLGRVTFLLISSCSLFCPRDSHKACALWQHWKTFVLVHRRLHCLKCQPDFGGDSGK